MSMYSELEDLERSAKRRRMAHEFDQTLVEYNYDVILEMFLRCNETFNENSPNEAPELITLDPEPLLIKDRFVAKYVSYYPAVDCQETPEFETQVFNVETPEFETQVFNVGTPEFETEVLHIEKPGFKAEVLHVETLDLETEVFNTIVDQLLIADCLARLKVNNM